MLQALSGYQYSAPRAALAFAPRVGDGQFRSLFTAGEAWGRVEIEGERVRLTVMEGELTLRSLRIGEQEHAFERARVFGPGQSLSLQP